MGDSSRGGGWHGSSRPKERIIGHHASKKERLGRNSSSYSGNGLTDSNLQRMGSGSKGRGSRCSFISVVGSKSVSVDATTGGDKETAEEKVTVDSVHEKRKASTASKQLIKKGKKKGKSKTEYDAERTTGRSTEGLNNSLEASKKSNTEKHEIEESCIDHTSNVTKLSSDASKHNLNLRQIDSLKIVTDNKEVSKCLGGKKDSSPSALPKAQVTVDDSYQCGLVVDHDDAIRNGNQLSNYTSQATGLKVLSVTTSTPGYIFTASDRAGLVKNIPGVVIINTAGKGDCLILGVDIEDEKLLKLIPELENASFRISLVETTERDTFSYFQDWKVIPRVDKCGMFQLIVSLRGPIGQVKRRNQLLELVKGLNISKVVHGEGETILLVGHVLEFVAYSDCIREVFSIERRHTWQPRPLDIMSPPLVSNAQERYLWVKVKCPEMSSLSIAHKQYSVHHELSQAGEVIQLEHQLFGAVDNYLAVVKDLRDIKDLGYQFDVLEIWPDSLPDHYTPTYGVDGWGFYSVSGKFPENLNPETRNSFAEDMKTLGAVGFRSGETENSFSLHFVNSSCIEQISRCAQYTTFRLTILSSMVRKPGFDKKLRRLVPAMLKYKELKVSDKFNSVSKEVHNIDTMIGNKEALQTIPDNSDQKLGKMMPKLRVVNGGSLLVGEKSLDQDQVSVKIKDDNVDDLSVDVKQTVKTSAVQTKVNAPEFRHDGYKGKSGKSVKKPKTEMKDVADKLKSDFVLMDETTLLKIVGKDSTSLCSHINFLCKFFAMVKDVVVTEDEDSKNVFFKFPSKKNVDKVLGTLCEGKPNSVEKIKLAPNKVIMDGSKFFKNKFGLVIVMKKSSSKENLEKDFANHGPIEIESRSRVSLVWFDTKLSLFKALTDRRVQKHKMFLSVQNFKFYDPVDEQKETEVDECEASKLTEIKIVDDPVNEIKGPQVDESEVLKLTEREVFGFLWHKKKDQFKIRDDQVISRLLTNFIKNVSCKELAVEEDGLSVIFSTAAQFRGALAQFCPSPLPDQAQLAALTRKFTLLPAKGSYGLFSTKRIKPEHFQVFTECIVRNSGIWFSNKLTMFQVLRDPLISKLYPALFIDCRNIFILSSKNMLAAGNSFGHKKPGSTSVMKTATMTIANSKGKKKPSPHVATKSSAVTQQDQVMKTRKVLVESTTPGQGVVTRSSCAKIEVSNSSPAQSSLVLNETKNTQLDVPADTAIITAREQITPEAPCPLLADIFNSNNAGLGSGKFGHIPTARMVRTGYKKGKLPVITSSRVVEENLFLENKECYREKNVAEAAGIIKNILHGKGEKVEGDTLREIKMKRVESFLKDKLGVVSDLLDQQKTQDILTKLRKPGIKDEGKSDVESNCQENNNIMVNDLSSLVGNKTMDEELNEDEAELVLNDSDGVKENVEPENDKICSVSEDNVDLSSETPVWRHDKDGAAMENETCVKQPPILTPDVLGLFTLMLSVPSDQDLDFLEELEEHISWFDTPVSMVRIGIEQGKTVIEVKMKDQDMAVAVLNGIKQTYPGLEGDTTGSQADIIPNKNTGLYTLCFTDTMKKRYKATMEKFQMYSKQRPIISKGLGKEQVLVGYVEKNAAIEALRDNICSAEFPKLHVAPVSRS